jgi:DNA-directed RNA polymerase subunit beta
VRDVHPTHYGRICPIETPEGPNIGLINSLATFAKVNKYGFIETPYRLVRDGKVVGDPRYLSAMEEERLVVAQADAEMDGEGKFKSELVSVRQGGDFRLVKPEEVTAIDVSPKQLVSVAAALIPFLENDDANRALMGSNMQRQAVPLIQADAPLVGTGMEAAVARDSGATIVARRDGVVDSIDGARIVVRATAEDGTTRGVDIYRLRKFQRSNQSTCLNQRPLVRWATRCAPARSSLTGRRRAGRAGAGPERALRLHALERLQLRGQHPDLGADRADDVFTSIHIEEFEVMARDTKLGQEEITRDIPNVGEEALRNLDEAGIVYIGAEVNPGDILVGKVTPKGESPMTPEEKLLRAIFGEKASDVRDTSLRPAAGRAGHDRGRARLQPPRRGQGRARHGDRARRDRAARQGPRRREGDPGAVFHSRLRERLLNRKASGGFKGVKAGTVIDDEVLDQFAKATWRQIGRAGRRGDGRDRGAEARVRRRRRAPAEALREQGREAAARRRAAARRDEDGQGLRRGEAEAAARRQDGRPPRQQGRRSAASCRSRTCRSWRTDAGGPRAEPARRAVAHERRPDPGDAPGLGLRQHRPAVGELVEEYRRTGRARTSCWSACARCTARRCSTARSRR